MTACPHAIASRPSAPFKLRSGLFQLRIGLSGCKVRKVAGRLKVSLRTARPRGQQMPFDERLEFAQAIELRKVLEFFPALIDLGCNLCSKHFHTPPKVFELAL